MVQQIRLTDEHALEERRVPQFNPELMQFPKAREFVLEIPVVSFAGDANDERGILLRCRPLGKLPDGSPELG
ncbi:MAG: hypothetical protein OXG42_07465, partial [Chloroflexi bacterium]|nr:hypothetical protein [Chloroflexota bacterium]